MRRYTRIESRLLPALFASNDRLSSELNFSPGKGGLDFRCTTRPA